MSTPAPFSSIAELLERSLSIRHVYGEPVHHGDTTVIPVARVAFAFGGGGGEAPRRSRKNESDASPSDPERKSQAQGAGGGGGVRMTPAGALEISTAGTRFIHFHVLTPWLCGGAMGLAAGWLVAQRRRPLRERGVHNHPSVRP